MIRNPFSFTGLPLFALACANPDSLSASGEDDPGVEMSEDSGPGAGSHEGELPDAEGSGTTSTSTGGSATDSGDDPDSGGVDGPNDASGEGDPTGNADDGEDEGEAEAEAEADATSDDDDPLECLDINLNDLLNYANQPVPDYIRHDNSGGNPITDEAATLGRVLFYDPSLSIDDTIACANCHKQEYAFSDIAEQSKGVAGVTHRHSMRLVNIRFGEDPKVRWDQTATLESQTTIPIKDAKEMGYSGTDGNPGMPQLIAKLERKAYYPVLFEFAFGDPMISEERMQLALAQFVRSIQSFDSRYDEGRAQVEDDLEDFPNFSLMENAGKRLFMEDFSYERDQITKGGESYDASRRTGGGLNCGNCHRPPEFDIDPESGNNGHTLDLDGVPQQDFSVTRSPSLRDMMNAEKGFNGGMFHTGRAQMMAGLNGHYVFREFDAGNPNLDDRLLPGGLPQWLDMSGTENLQLSAFLATLTGVAVYTDRRWSNPFVCR